MISEAPPKLLPPTTSAVHDALLSWYARYGRDLPWRHTRDPYAVLVSEIMLQQTQVDRVIPKWHAWLARFPTIRDLASASRADAVREWQGLGYNLRAVRLHEIARQ
jgi:A/G-specific adenine glycosylase